MPKKYRDNDSLLGGDLYTGGTYSEGGTYMLVYTVLLYIPTNRITTSREAFTSILV